MLTTHVIKFNYWQKDTTDDITANRAIVERQKQNVQPANFKPFHLCPPGSCEGLGNSAEYLLLHFFPVTSPLVRLVITSSLMIMYISPRMALWKALSPQAAPGLGAWIMVLFCMCGVCIFSPCPTDSLLVLHFICQIQALTQPNWCL